MQLQSLCEVPSIILALHRYEVKSYFHYLVYTSGSVVPYKFEIIFQFCVSIKAQCCAFSSLMNSI